jgi:AcrR family transcriptional regulator
VNRSRPHLQKRPPASPHRTGGRSARVRNAVIEAAKSTLLERGLEGFSIAEVADRSGVHETSIYRRWGTKPALIAETLLTHFEEALPIPDTGTLRGDLIALLRNLAGMLKSRLGIALVRVIAGSDGANEDVAAIRDIYWAHRRQKARLVLMRGIERGELQRNVDLDLILDTLIGTFYVRALITDTRLSIDLPILVTDLVLRGASCKLT